MRFDSQETLRHIESRLNKPTRSLPQTLIRKFLRDRPAWTLGEDPIRKVYDQMEQTVQRGEIRWAAVIHANETVFTPGPHTSGAQIVYDASGDASLEAVIASAGKCYETKHSERVNDEEIRLGEMLVDEMERALDWPIPASLAEGTDMYTTITMLPREDMPYRFMALKHFPVLADPTSRLTALVPYTFWDEDYLRAWKREAIKTLISIKLANNANAIQSE